MTRRSAAPCRLVAWLLAGCFMTLVTPCSVWSEDARSERSVLGGAGKVVGGFLFDLPKTVIETTSIAPPLIIVGMVAGPIRAVQVASQGLKEMSEAFDPWGIKQGRRSQEP